MKNRTIGQFLALAGGGLLAVLALLAGCRPVAATSAATAPAPPANPLVTTAWLYPDSLDAVVAAPQFHRILFENERVRVLEVTVPPHTREPLHTHRWPSVLYRERYGTGRYYDATGQLVHEFTKLPQKAVLSPRARWQAPEGPHAVENTDEVADRFLRVEIKP